MDIFEAIKTEYGITKRDLKVKTTREKEIVCDIRRIVANHLYSEENKDYELIKKIFGYRDVKSVKKLITQHEFFTKHDENYQKRSKCIKDKMLGGKRGGIIPAQFRHNKTEHTPIKTT